IIGRLFDSNGTTLLRSVTATTTAITSGGIAFRGTSSDKYFDTVTVSYGANSFAISASAGQGSEGEGNLLVSQFAATSQEHTTGAGAMVCSCEVAAHHGAGARGVVHRRSG